jgi:cytochrome c peroxidase
MKRMVAVVATSVGFGLGAAGCAPTSASFTSDESQISARAVVTSSDQQIDNEREATRLFERETFGGNGRTCSTCHAAEDGFSITPASAQRRFAANPKDPLFQPADSDDGAGTRYERLLAHATIRVTIPLTCPNIWLEDDPRATSVVLNRGIPELLDTPALDPILMSDGRVPDLEHQALAAVQDHLSPRVQPSSPDVRRIAQHQVTDPFFSSDLLRAFARGGPLPDLPTGRTPAEIRGRVHFLPTGLCGRCHSGPMLNTTTEASVLGAGKRFNTTRVGELVPEQRVNPFVRWHVINDDGSHRVFSDFADPGRMLITCKRGDLTKFKIRSLWNVRNTAPYFHDNSAKTLEDVMAHYKAFFALRKLIVSEQELADMLAYLKLL